MSGSWRFRQPSVPGPCLEIVVRMCNHVPFQLYHIVLQGPIARLYLHLSARTLGGPLNRHASNLSSLPVQIGSFFFRSSIHQRHD